MIGAGVIGVEYATIFSALDVAVTLVEARPTLLDFIDHELIEEFTHQLRDRGMALRFGAKVARIEFENDWPVTDPGERPPRARRRCCCIPPGRVGATDTLNLDACGLAADDRGRIKVDPQTFQTEVPHIYCRRRCDRLSQPRLDLDGAGAHRRLPRLRHAAAAAAGVLSPMASIRCRKFPPWA